MARRGLILAAALAAAAISPAAQAATGSPPVTHPDEIVVFAGDAVLMDPADNDTDPDGDSLQVCRLGSDVPRKLAGSTVQDGDVVVAPSRKARGTYTLVYYACDTSYLTAGTITVHVKPPRPTLEVIPIGDAPPGPMRIKNTYKNRTFHCQWQATNSDKIEGKATVKPRSSVVIHVKEANLEIDCESGNSSYGFGFVGGRDAGRPLATKTYSAKASGGGQAHTRLRSP
jgi:hypothetical protein